MRKALLLLGVLVCAAPLLFAQNVTQGSLFATGPKGKELGACPLKNTTVTVDVSGFVARVRVVQDFENPFPEPIEAVYTFPLSQNGAVDQMTMLVGTRTIRGKIMKREEARKVYESARSEGKTAALLDQERPNIFTQSVANVMPGESVRVEISYVETLKYEDGAYEFVFPMTVGPRYIPGDGVPDAARILPPIAATRAGHDVSITINLDAGVPVESVRSSSHDIEQINFSPNAARVSLKNEKVIPNKDFILRYDVTGNRLEDAVLAHRSARGGFFTLILQPPDMPAPEDRTPKEIVFVLDTSGSMYGFPIEKAKEAMKLALDGLYPEDTFNLITFAGDTRVLFQGPVPATQANIEAARAFLDEHRGGGGTEMMKAIKAALDPSDSKEHVRVVCFMTDGYVGNENEIIAEVQRHPKARIFSFGIGNSVNRFLLDKLAEAGRGEVEYVSLNDDGSKAAKRFHERVRSPMLTDISVDWNGLAVSDAYPAKLPDLFSAKPIIISGRYARGGKGTIKLRGSIAGQPYEREIAVTLPDAEPANDSLASLWARKRVDELTSEALNSPKAADLNKQITDLGLEFGLMTQFTSFVAVEERIVNRSGQPVKVEVPVEIPDGVNVNTAVGSQQEVVTVTGDAVAGLPVNARSVSSLLALKPGVVAKGKAPSIQTGGGSGSGMGTGTGYGSGSGSPPPPVAATRTISGGVVNGNAINLPAPVYPAAARAANATGSVAVQVTIDETGKVIAATAVSGNPLFRAAATEAAKGASFAPTMLSGQPVKVTGVIVYNFGGPSIVTMQTGTLTPADGSSPAAPVPAVADTWDASLKSKLHTWVYALAKRLESNSPAGADESHFVRDGRVNLRVEFAKLPPGLRERLKTLGFTIDSEKGSMVTGSIPLEKLLELIGIDDAKLILPDLRARRK